VALCEGRHSGQQQHDFIRSLIQDPRFARAVDDIVVEFGNALYQPVIDRYLAGADIPREELQKVWRDTTQPQTLSMEAPVIEQFFAAVRALNLKSASGKKVRVLLGDPPIDWSDPDVKPRLLLAQRNKHFVAVVEGEVLAKRHKALLIAGGRHFARNQSKANTAAQIEAAHPGQVFIAEFHDDLGEQTMAVEARLAAWPQPGFVEIAGTWLGQIDPALRYPASAVMAIRPDGTSAPAPNLYEGMKLQDVIDGYIYLCPASRLTLSPIPSEDQIDAKYLGELKRRRALMQPGRQAISAPLGAR